MLLGYHHKFWALGECSKLLKKKVIWSQNYYNEIMAINYSWCLSGIINHPLYFNFIWRHDKFFVFEIELLLENPQFDSKKIRFPIFLFSQYFFPLFKLSLSYWINMWVFLNFIPFSEMIDYIFLFLGKWWMAVLLLTFSRQLDTWKFWLILGLVFYWMLGVGVSWWEENSLMLEFLNVLNLF